VSFNILLDSNQHVFGRPGNSLTVDREFAVRLVAGLGHWNGKFECRQLCRRRWIEIVLQAVAKLTWEVDVVTGEISDGIRWRLSRLSSKCGYSVDVLDVDSQKFFVLPTESRPLFDETCSGDIWMGFVDCLEAGEIYIYIWRLPTDKKSRGVIVDLFRHCTVDSCFPLEDAAIIQKIDFEWHRSVTLWSHILPRNSHPNKQRRGLSGFRRIG